MLKNIVNYFCIKKHDSELNTELNTENLPIKLCELNYENLPIKLCPDCKAEPHRKKRKLDEFQESACEHKKFEFQKESMLLCPELEIHHKFTMAMKHSHRTV